MKFTNQALDRSKAPLQRKITQNGLYMERNEKASDLIFQVTLLLIPFRFSVRVFHTQPLGTERNRNDNLISQRTNFFLTGKYELCSSYFCFE